MCIRDRYCNAVNVRNRRLLCSPLKDDTLSLAITDIHLKGKEASSVYIIHINVYLQKYFGKKWQNDFSVLHRETTCNLSDFVVSSSHHPSQLTLLARAGGGLVQQHLEGHELLTPFVN